LKPPPQGGSGGPANLHHPYSTASSKARHLDPDPPSTFVFTSSARITRHHRYYETVRPCAPPPVLNPLRLTTSWSAPSRPRLAARDTFETTGSRVSVQKPEPSSRHLHAGHHLGGKQVSPRLIPETRPAPSFDAIYTFDTSAVVRSRSPS
jgi:hypothetical protein